MGKKVITVFGSSKPQKGDSEYLEAYSLGGLLAKEGFDVCNGGYLGIMEASAKGACENGADTIGVTLSGYKADPNRFITKNVQTDELYSRLKELVNRADAYVVLKGGSGTLLEVSLCLELILKGMMAVKPMVFVGEHFRGVVDLIRKEALANTKSYPRVTLDIFDEFIFFAHNAGEAVDHIRNIL